MNRMWWIFVLLGLLPSACGVQPAFFWTATPSQNLLPQETPTLAPSAIPTQLPTATPTSIPSPTVTPTDTPLPPLVPPTLEPFAPLQAFWQGEPVYAADSKPGYLFQLEYATLEWGMSVDYSGQPALVHRRLPGCFIVAAPPRGLPPGVRVETLQKTLGNIPFDVNIIRDAQGNIQSLMLTGGDGNILTAFQVETGAEAEACLQAVETLLSTLRSIPQP
ncbi:MAG: hypothetical protein WHS87_08420 [Anaerolineales bacterium]